MQINTMPWPCQPHLCLHLLTLILPTAAPALATWTGSWQQKRLLLPSQALLPPAVFCLRDPHLAKQQKREGGRSSSSRGTTTPGLLLQPCSHSLWQWCWRRKSATLPPPPPTYSLSKDREGEEDRAAAGWRGEQAGAGGAPHQLPTTPA